MRTCAGRSSLSDRHWSEWLCAADEALVIRPVLIGIALGHVPIFGARRQPGGMGGEHADPGLAEIERLEQCRDPCVLVLSLIEEAGPFQRIIVAVQAAEEVDDGGFALLGDPQQPAEQRILVVRRGQEIDDADDEDAGSAFPLLVKDENALEVVAQQELVTEARMGLVAPAQKLAAPFGAIDRQRERRRPRPRPVDA